VEEQRGTQELIDFATKSLKSLIKQEEQHENVKSDLRLFCCMKIGVMAGKSQYHYFINGLSRTWNIAIFRTSGNSELIDKGDYICQQLVHYLPMFLCEI
jgi:hypothetical protein